MNIHEYGAYLAENISAGNWPAIVAEIHGINLPDGWQAMVRPMIDDLAGKSLTVSVIPFNELPEHMLHWLRMAPDEVLAATTQALRIGYDESTADGKNTGNIELAIYQQETGPAILMVGG